MNTWLSVSETDKKHPNRETKEISSLITEAVRNRLQKTESKHEDAETIVRPLSKKTGIKRSREVVQTHRPLLTFHKLVSSDNFKFACSEETQEQRVWFVLKALLHQLGQVVSFCRPFLHHSSEALQRRGPSLIRLIQLILRLHNSDKNTFQANAISGRKRPSLLPYSDQD